MKKDKRNLLLKILRQNNDDWMSSDSLAKLLHVTPRTVRNYIKQIREEMLIDIETSKNGYRLKKLVPSEYKKESQIDERIYFIISKLLSSPNGISVFELAEELLVSESTILNSSIPEIKKIILPFDLTIQTKNYNIFLIGTESDKRKMIGYLVTHNNYGFFTSEDTLEKIFPDFEINNLMNSLYDLFEDSALFINNYAMNNLMIHILIILARVNSNEQLATLQEKNNIDELLSSFPQKDEIIKLTNKIYDYFKKTFNIDIPKKDYQQIILLIYLSANYDIENLNSIIDHSFISDMNELIFQVSYRYNIEMFNQEFISQLTLHMYNAKERSQFNISYPNPFSQQVKEKYALIYDMAVYFAHIFSEKYCITLPDNEIAFIALHFGAYLENNNNYQSAITCIIIVEDYLDFSKVIYQQIKNNFQKEIIIKQVMSLNQYIKFNPKCELLISILNVPLEHPHQISINPIITNKDLADIRSELDILIQKKKIQRARIFLKNCFHEKIYFKNIHLGTPSAYIKFMGNECLKNNYIKPNFIEDVLLRESLSSTSFADFVAIPHTLNQYADRSFICVIHNDLPISWDKNKVNFILLIGVSQSDMEYFNDAFNILTELFLSPDNQIKLLKTNNIEEFTYTILENS